ncbi:hypothetical protein [Longirhabdus pacifica]|uniref:hypothetical protein n=1 Tax=Longirhabdus pacifica TaxID=2305227 RepID=UPI001008B885|nr:hypothetical protein [Longirhabdus pacifica]
MSMVKSKFVLLDQADWGDNISDVQTKAAGEKCEVGQNGVTVIATNEVSLKLAMEMPVDPQSVYVGRVKVKSVSNSGGTIAIGQIGLNESFEECSNEYNNFVVNEIALPTNQEQYVEGMITGQHALGDHTHHQFHPDAKYFNIGIICKGKGTWQIQALEVYKMDKAPHVDYEPDTTTIKGTTILDASSDEKQSKLEITEHGLTYKGSQVSEQFSIANEQWQQWQQSIYSYESKNSQQNPQPIHYKELKDSNGSVIAKGLQVNGELWMKLRMQMPVDGQGVYIGKIKARKLTGNGYTYAGQIPLDEQKNEINSTDKAVVYNYFITISNTFSPSSSAEGLITGYNHEKEGNHQKFDPTAKYFDISIICNFIKAGGSLSELDPNASTLIESLEVYKLNDKNSVVVRDEHGAVYSKEARIPTIKGNTVIDASSGSKASKLELTESAITYNGQALALRDASHGNDFFLGNTDWSSLIYSNTENATYYYKNDGNDMGMVVEGKAFLKVRMQMPIDPDSMYVGRVKVRPLSGKGRFYAGQIALNEKLNEFRSDQAHSYNYFISEYGLAEYNATTNKSLIFEGRISGYNAPDESNDHKFDPNASYFDLVLLCNFYPEGENVSTLIESIEVCRIPNIRQKELVHQGSNFILGNNDWSSLIYWRDGNDTKKFYYSSEHKGMIIDGDMWIKARMQMPIDPESKYIGRVRMRKLDGNGKFFAGQAALDHHFNNISSDKATAYNYFIANGVTVSPQQTESQIFEGSITGYNTATQGDHHKFEPGASYFDLVFVCNYKGSGKTLIEAVEICKVPKSYGAEHITIKDSKNYFASNNIEGALSELFQNVSDGKKKIAAAITDMGQSANENQSFSQMAAAIKKITTGKRHAQGTFELDISSTYSDAITISSLPFSPSIIRVYGIDSDYNVNPYRLVTPGSAVYFGGSFSSQGIFKFGEIFDNSSIHTRYLDSISLYSRTNGFKFSHEGAHDNILNGKVTFKWIAVE